MSDKSHFKAVADWNMQQAADCYRQLKRENNYYERQEIRRNASRFTRNEVSLRLALRKG